MRLTCFLLFQELKKIKKSERQSSVLALFLQIMRL